MNTYQFVINNPVTKVLKVFIELFFNLHDVLGIGCVGIGLLYVGVGYMNRLHIKVELMLRLAAYR